VKKKSAINVLHFINRHKSLINGSNYVNILRTNEISFSLELSIFVMNKEMFCAYALSSKSSGKVIHFKYVIDSKSKEETTT
jgi:hypothetical protein